MSGSDGVSGRSGPGATSTLLAAPRLRGPSVGSGSDGVSGCGAVGDGPSGVIDIGIEASYDALGLWHGVPERSHGASAVATPPRQRSACSGALLEAAGPRPPAVRPAERCWADLSEDDLTPALPEGEGCAVGGAAAGSPRAAACPCAEAVRLPALHVGEGDGFEAATRPREGTSAAAADLLVLAPPVRAEGDGAETGGVLQGGVRAGAAGGLACSGWAAARVLAPALRVTIRGFGFRDARARLEEAASAIPDARGRRRVAERVLQAAEGPRRARHSPPGRRSRDGRGSPAPGAAEADAMRRLCTLPAEELARELRARAEAFQAFPELAAEAEQLVAAAEGDPAADGPAALAAVARRLGRAGGA